jgi:hypothetical protein
LRTRFTATICTSRPVPPVIVTLPGVMFLNSNVAPGSSRATWENVAVASVDASPPRRCAVAGPRRWTFCGARWELAWARGINTRGCASCGDCAAAADVHAMHVSATTTLRVLVFIN